MQKRTSVIIVGGGFAGVEAARGLDDRLDVTLIAAENFHLFTPMLAEVAAGDIEPRHIVAPLRELCPKATVVIGSVISIDTDTHTVVVQSPIGGPPRSYTADALVLAAGSIPATFGVEGADTCALPFKTINDALRIRRRVVALLEEAAVRNDPSLTKVAIIGAGFSGAELAAGLADFLGEAQPKFYPTAPPPVVTLVDALDRVTPTLPSRLSRAAGRALVRRCVTLRLGHKVAGVTPHGVELDTGELVDSATVIWAAGIKPNPLVSTVGDGTRLAVDGNLRVGPGIYALGDVALVPDGAGGICPPTAQHAVRQGRYLGKHLPALLEGAAVKAFRYRTKGQLVSLGHRNAVGLVMGVKVSGFIAWWLWRSYYWSRMPTWLRKMRVGLDWAVDVIFPPDISELPSVDIGPLPPID